MKYCIIGGGLAGLGISYKLLQNPSNQVILIDKKNLFTLNNKLFNNIFDPYGIKVFSYNYLSNFNLIKNPNWVLNYGLYKIQYWKHDLMNQEIKKLAILNFNLVNTIFPNLLIKGKYVNTDNENTDLEKFNWRNQPVFTGSNFKFIFHILKQLLNNDNFTYLGNTNLIEVQKKGMNYRRISVKASDMPSKFKIESITIENNKIKKIFKADKYIICTGSNLGNFIRRLF